MTFVTNFQKFTRELKRSCQLTSWRPLFLAESISFSGKRSLQLKLYYFQRKPILLVEVIPSSGSHSFQWKPFLLVEAVSFNGSRFFQSKLILLVKTIPFGGNISCSENMPVMKAIPFNGSRSFQLKLYVLLEPFLLMETISVSGSHSLQQKPFLLI